MDGKAEKEDLTNKMIYGDLSYRVIGVVFDVYNTIGSCHKENYIQHAIAIGLDSLHINYKKELRVPVIYKEKKLGHYYLDFVIDNRIILEIKRGNRLSLKDFEQIKGYLKMLALKLGILVLFSDTKVRFPRILNLY